MDAEDEEYSPSEEDEGLEEKEELIPGGNRRLQPSNEKSGDENNGTQKTDNETKRRRKLKKKGAPPIQSKTHQCFSLDICYKQLGFFIPSLHSSSSSPMIANHIPPFFKKMQHMPFLP